MTLVILEVVAKPECVDSMKEMLKTALPDTRSYDGCQDVTVFLNEDGRTFVLVERWDSKEHYEKYLEWRTDPGAGVTSLDDLGSMIAEEPSIRYWEPVGV